MASFLRFSLLAAMNDAHVVRSDRDRLDFGVHRAAMVDPGVLEQEMRRIFDKCWIYAGHVSEVRAAGDFVRCMTSRTRRPTKRSCQVSCWTRRVYQCRSGIQTGRSPSAASLRRSSHVVRSHAGWMSVARRRWNR